MPTDEEKLLVRLEVSQAKFEKQLSAMAKSADRRSRQMENRFTKANRQISSGFDKVGKAGAAAFTRMGVAAAALVGGLGVRELSRYADAWTMVENKIAAAEQVSGMAARSTSELNDLANASRAGLEETADLYAKLLRVSGQLGATEEEVAQATEIVAKSFKAGGSAASEQAAGILQLSQALGSGFLQGDELRSLRENAPLIAQAIADEFETTVGGLKDLGAEGELTAERVFSAILKSQEGIEAAFSRTIPTIQDGLTALSNGLLELVGGFNSGSGAAEGLAGWLQVIGEELSGKAEAATRFGAQVSEAFAIMGEAIDSINSAFGSVDNASTSTMQQLMAVGNTVSELSVGIYASMNGAAEAIAQAFANMISAVGSANLSVVNGTISAVEEMINFIVGAIDNLIGRINDLNSLVNKINPFSDIPEISKFGKVDIGRYTPETLPEAGDISDAFDSGFEAVIQKYESVLQRIETAGDNAIIGEFQGPNMPSASTGPTPGTAPAGISGIGGSGGRRSSPAAKVIRSESAAIVEETEIMMDDFGGAVESGLNALLLQGKSFKDAMIGIAVDMAGNLAQSLGQAGVSGLTGAIFGRSVGGPVMSGQPYRVNENTPRSEIFVPSQNGAILNTSQAQRALSGPSSGGGAASLGVRVYVDDDGKLGAIARQEGAKAAYPVSISVVKANNEKLKQSQRR